MFLTICGCCITESGVITVRAFGAGSGTMLWEVPNFYTTGKSPNNTLWGWSVRKITPTTYTRRVSTGIVTTTGGSQPGGSAWPAKTNPGSYGLNAATIAIDLCSVNSSGVKSTLVADWIVYTGTRSASPGSIFSDFPTGSHTDTRRLYTANDSGKVMLSGFGVPEKMVTTSGQAEAIIEDPVLDSLVMKMTLRAIPLINGGSAMWVFRRASTNASFPLYGTAAEVVTALSALPGVASVTATGGPCCSADMNIEVTWTAAANTFSDAWITYASTTTSGRTLWDWTTGTPSHLLTFTPWSFTTDGAGLINSSAGFRRDLTSPSSNPWGTNGSNVWSATYLSTYNQTNERTRISSATIWEAVPISTGVSDVRNGVILISRTRARVPVVEPSGSAMTTHLTASDSTGTAIATHDCHLNPQSPSWLTESGDIGATGPQYAYAHQGGDEGVATVPGSSFFATVPGRSHSGRHFATGTVNMFEPFATQSRVFALSDSYSFSTRTHGSVDTTAVWFDWTFNAYGSLSGTELWSSGDYVACRWQSFPANAPIFGIPAHRREYWLTFSGELWPAVPPDLEYRYVHLNGGSVVKSTAWLGVSATTADVLAELDAWYGEPIAGYPTIRIVGTVEDHDFQTQPFWQYMPLAHIEIWTDATGAVYAPRGRVLGIQFRNGTTFQQRSLTGMSRTTGVILWQKDAGIPHPDYTTGVTKMGGFGLYATDAQLVVATLCQPVLQDDVLLGDCVWEWDGSVWVILTDGCSSIAEAVAPVDPGTTVGETASGTCELI